jgi:eukaryotic-like serine/threonine-protein kinase
MIIGQYRVTGMIGQGGMGAVYAGEHVLLGRAAAIKVLLPELSQRQDAVTRFFNEARAAAAVKHPGIVEIYDFGWSDGAAFIVMEHLEGETLSRRALRGRMGWRAALAVVRQIAGAVGAAHAKTIVHRDLKPDNIFLVRDPEVPGGERIKLLDFGIAKLTSESSPGMAMTRTGAVMGTPTYMSHEQCRGVVADHRSDLYALGCIAFELCGGRPPFVGEATGDVLAAHIHVPAPSLASLSGEVPPEVERLVHRLLAKSPADRVQCAADVIAAIDAITGDVARPNGGASSERLPVVATTTITTLSGATHGGLRTTHASGRRGRALAIAAAALAISAVVAVAAVHDRDEGPPAPAIASVAGTAATSSAPAHEAPTQARGTGEPAARTAEPSAQTAGLPALAAKPPAQTAEPPALAAKPSAHTAEPPPQTAKPSADLPRPPQLPESGPGPTDVAIETVPPGAQLMTGGALLGKTPFHGLLPHHAGDVTLVIRLAGYVEKSVVVHGDRSIREHIKLAPIPAVRAPRVDRDRSVNPFGE